MSVCVCMHVYILFLLEAELWIFAFPYSLLIDLSPMIYAVIQVDILKEYFFSLVLTFFKLKEAQMIEKLGLFFYHQPMSLYPSPPKSLHAALSKLSSFK